MPLAHGIPSTSNFSGDTLIVIPITNNSGTNFAYPLAKIVPVTALPAGMTESGGMDGWNVFGSSWNDGQTNDAAIPYSVAAPIPADFMFSFILRVSNFLPLSTDSCYFTDTITINLNPTTSGMVDFTNGLTSVNTFPNPAHSAVNFVSHTLKIETLIFYNMQGKSVFMQTVNSQTACININELLPGIYSCKIKLENGQVAVRKIVIER